MTQPQTLAPAGRRDRSMTEKRQRIFEAAESLFQERGFSAVTTLAVSERADIGAGTLFRYAATKNELLLLVYNERLRTALRRGSDAAQDATDVTEAIVAMLTPMIELSAVHAENLQAYQRELLFGAPAETYRQEGLSLIAALEEAIAARLCQQTQSKERHAAVQAGRLASNSIFAVTHMVISRASTGAHSGHDPKADLRGQIAQIIRGFFASLRESDVPRMDSDN